MKKAMNIETKQQLQGLLFISPWLIGLGLFWIYPLLNSLAMSFNKVTIKTDHLEWSFIGWDNYQKVIFSDTDLIDNIVIFVQESLLMLPIIVVFALIVALLLNQKFEGRGMFRAVFFLPVIMTTGNLIMELLGQGTGTMEFLQNESLKLFIAENFSTKWASTINTLLNSFIIILWYSGVQIQLLIAGMQSISPSIYEAASIDGANSWERLWKITLPGIAPFILLSTIYTIVDQFTLPLNPVLNYVYTHMTNVDTGMGYSSAISWIYFSITLLMIGCVFLVFRKSVDTNRPRRSGIR